MPTQFVTNPRRNDQRAYTHYSTYVNARGERKIAGGWEYVEDAQDAVREIRQDARDVGMTVEGLKVYTRTGLLRLGIDPKENANWDHPATERRNNPRRRTVRRNPSPRPSVKTLSHIVTPAEAKKLRDMMETSSARSVLRAASRMMDGFDVEYIASSSDTSRNREGLSYVNMGDSYMTTLIYDHGKGRYIVSSWGDIVERDTKRFGY
jgi:hypothetical protein